MRHTDWAMPSRSNLIATLLLVAVGLSGCSGARTNPTDPAYMGYQGPTAGNMPGGSVLGDSNLMFGSGGKGRSADNAAGGGAGALGVNAYLWRGALDTLSFMPLASADPFGIVIITDWYSATNAPNERLKVTIYILDRRLRADGINP